MTRQSPDRELGATATEYVIMVAGIAVVIVLSIFVYGHFLSDKWMGTTSDIQTQVTTLSSH